MTSDKSMLELTFLRFEICPNDPVIPKDIAERIG